MIMHVHLEAPSWLVHSVSVFVKIHVMSLNLIENLFLSRIKPHAYLFAHMVIRYIFATLLSGASARRFLGEPGACSPRKSFEICTSQIAGNVPTS